MLTSTPLGTVTGSFPIRDMVEAPSPDVGEDFPTHALHARLPVGQQTGRRGDDRHAEAAEDLGQVRRLRIDPQTRLGDPADAGDAALAVTPVLEVDHQGAADLGLLS